MLRTGEDDGKLRGDEEGSPGDGNPDDGNLAGDGAGGDEEGSPGEGNPDDGNLAGDGARESAREPTMSREDLVRYVITPADLARRGARGWGWREYKKMLSGGGDSWEGRNSLFPLLRLQGVH